MRAMKHLVASLLLCGAIALPAALPSPLLAQDAAPAVRDGGERSGPAPVEPHPLAYGVIAVALLAGIGIGVGAVLVIRGWDRSRPSEREIEAHQSGPRSL